MAPLVKYKEKRNFKVTPEPTGGTPGKKPIFVVQEHHARRLHYDFRLEHDGVLLSWAVPKGPPMEPDEKRLAVQTEDHPLDYAKFSGTIPEGEYGAGAVFIWDSGTFENVSVKDGKPISMEQALEKGHVKVSLQGRKLHGVFSLVRTRSRDWLLITHESQTPEINTTHLEKVLFPKSGLTKKDFIEYYVKIAPHMLRHLSGRPISMSRFPDGINGEIFFQKNVPDYFPEWITTVPIQHHERVTTYAVCDYEYTLYYLANQVMIPHIWSSRIDKLEYPDKLIFDLDPQDISFKFVCDAAREIRDLLTDVKLQSFVMTTGSKGLHVVVPIDGKLNFDKISSFARVIAQHLEKNNPDLFTAEHRKEKRGSRVFVDTYRNAFAQTAVPPYAVRSIEGAPVAMPVEWEELNANLSPQKYNIKNAFARLDKKGDIWEKIYGLKQSLQKI